MKVLKSLPAVIPVWLATVAAAWADMAPGGGYEGGYGGHHAQMWEGGWGGMVFGPLMGLVFIVAIAVAVVLVVRAVSGGGAAQGGQSALDILDERFARGEIDEKEYAARKQVLTGD